MPSVDEELNQIERDIRTLKIEYEQFFGGGRSRPPADTQWRVETLLRRYNERTAELSFAQRFRYNGLAQTYAKYVDMWRKKTMQKESGTQQRHFGAAAKTIEAERARQAQARAASIPPPVGIHPVAVADTPAHAAAAHAAEERKTAESFAMSFSDPSREKEKVHKLYENLIKARSETGEKSGAPTLKDFERFVRQKTKELKEKGGQEIEYTVSVESGRVKLKARVSN